jgi:hypothetical protein
MAKKAKGESLSARFKQLFTEHPDWLDLEKNDPIFDHWRQATGAAMDKRTRGVMANVKSRLRQKLRGGRGRPGRKPGRKPGTLAASRASVAELERLELMIDGCLARARELEAAKIEDVTKHLRLARNAIVLMFGNRA